MFSDGFESVGPISGNKEQVSAEILGLTKCLKLALKDQDWQFCLHQLEALPLLDKLSLNERNLLAQSLTAFREVVEQRKKHQFTFSSESLTDLSETIDSLLAAKEREFGL